MTKLDAVDPRTLKAQVMAAYKRADVRKEALNLNGAVADSREAERLPGSSSPSREKNAQALRLQWVATEKFGETLLAARDPGAPLGARGGDRPCAFAHGHGVERSRAAARRRPQPRKRGPSARAAGDPATALSRFEDYLKMIERLVAEHPSDPLFTRDEAVALINVGLTKFSVGDIAGANSTLNAALDIAKHGAGEDPLNARAKHDLLAVLSARAQVNLEPRQGRSARRSQRGAADRP